MNHHADLYPQNDVMIILKVKKENAFSIEVHVFITMAEFTIRYLFFMSIIPIIKIRVQTFRQSWHVACLHVICLNCD